MTSNIYITEEVEAPMTDEEATELDWFLLEVFTKMILGDRHEINKTKLP
jgi:hypothetical protein